MRRVEACVEARQRLGLDLLVGGELLGLLRPLLYVMVLRRCVQGFIMDEAVCKQFSPVLLSS